MRGKRLGRLLVLVLGTMLGVLLFTTWASAREFTPRGIRSFTPRNLNTPNNLGIGLTGPPTAGGASAPRFNAGHAGDITPSLFNAPAVIDPPSSRSLSPRFHTAPSFFTPLDTIIQGQNSGVGGIATSGDATAVNTLGPVQVGPVGGAQVGDNVSHISQNTFAQSGDAIVNSQVFGNTSTFSSGSFFGSGWPFNDDPFFHSSSHFGTHGFGSGFWSPFNNSVFVSGDNVMSTSPWGTTFISGDNVFVANSHSFWGSPFWGSSSWSSPFWGSPFHTTSLIASEVQLEHLELLVDMADSCLARLAANPSFARSLICQHLLEQVAERTWSTPTLGSWSPFGIWHPTTFLSQGGTSALFSSDGFSAVSSSAGNTFVSDFGPWGWGPFGFGFGGSHTFPVGASDRHLAVLTPWSWSPAFAGGGFWPASSVDVWTLRRELAELRAQIESSEANLEFLAWHRSLVLGTIHSHSLSWSPWFGGFAPFGHRTVFVSGDNVFVAGSPFHDTFWSPFGWNTWNTWDNDFWWDNVSWNSNSCWWWNSSCFWGWNNTNFFSRARFFGPVLDMPGITVGGWL